VAEDLGDQVNERGEQELGQASSADAAAGKASADAAAEGTTAEGTTGEGTAANTAADDTAARRAADGTAPPDAAVAGGSQTGPDAAAAIPPTDQPALPPAGRAQRIWVRAILAFATLLAVLAIFAIWANRQLLNPTNWSNTSTALLPIYRSSRVCRANCRNSPARSPVRYMVSPNRVRKGRWKFRKSRASGGGPTTSPTKRS
jgi:hypothetical protein